MDNSIASLRRDYSSQSLLETDVATHPVDQFEIWWQQAMKSEIVEANAMTLATASNDGMPAARIVLLKDFDEKGFVFYTNYNSFKGQQLLENPKACLLLFWKELERQVRITGIVEKVSSEESNAYFSSRPRESQVGAVVSPQSQVIESRQWLDEKFKHALDQFENAAVERPAHWGGYVVTPVIIEFWQGRPGRLHDRIQYTLLEDGRWKIERLAP